MDYLRKGLRGLLYQFLFLTSYCVAFLIFRSGVETPRNSQLLLVISPLIRSHKSILITELRKRIWYYSVAFWVQCITQSISDKIKTEQGNSEKTDRKNKLPVINLHCLCTIINQGSPAGHGFLYSQSQKT